MLKNEAPPNVLDKRELSRLLRAVDRDDARARLHPGKRERDRLLLALFAYAGLRRSELLGGDVARSFRVSGYRFIGHIENMTTCSPTLIRFTSTRVPSPTSISPG